MSKVKTITVSNLKAISNLTADFNGCTAIITGGNNKGKSSFLRSLPDRLKQTKPDVILKEGETEGFAEWELTTGEKFRWQFDSKTKAGEKLIFITKENIKTSITKEISERYFPKGFDIDKFLNDGPQKQREMLQKIVGIDFTDVDRRYKQAYENRTFANKQLEADRQKLKPINEDLPNEPKPYIELQQQLAGIDAHNQKYEYVTEGIQEKQSKVTSLENEILRLKDLISAEEEKIKTLEADIVKGQSWLSVKDNQPKTEEEAAELKSKIDSIIKENEEIEANNKAIEIKSQFDRSEKEAQEADDLVKKIESEKVDMIRNAKLPVGFGFSDDGVTYLGHSLSKAQLSTSAIYIAALKLAALNIGEVKTLHFDASYLDKNSLQEIENWAKENDLQLLIERPDFDGGEIEFHLIDAVS
ncbi:hypothetical protein [Sphingobacterium multivorum]|uniref:Uncharacterized protein n=1 Tax=Sphingobacterium multivorum TaxID=28454 RepID=A0A654D2U9_SPHMU|nr:hypothetical protein [Sphingobacterium multivorum]VXC99591.1 conserved hypothetical protein [Sphingobacterium multivorum]